MRETEGIIHLMTNDEEAAAEPLVQSYEQVRRDERWGGDDLDLPFHPKRHRDIWWIRQRTFSTFESLAIKFQRGVALDVGAGNCWMTRYLARWGFDAIALDMNTSSLDGLCAGQKFIDEGDRFLRVRARMERLPFISNRIRLLAFNASFHYVGDFRAALSEFERVLAPGGIIAIIDTPFYRNAADGERMMAERAEEFRRKYGMPEALARRSRYLTFRELGGLADSIHLKPRLYPVWPGFRRKYEELRSSVLGRPLAQFPIVLLEKNEE